MSKYFVLIFLSASLLISKPLFAQANTETAQLKKLYEGTWYNKKDKRYLHISFENDNNFFTVNDWVKGEKDNMDTYNAYIKNDKLILNADSTEHRAPYCELHIEKKLLVVECNNIFNVRDNFLNKNDANNVTSFIRLHK